MDTATNDQSEFTTASVAAAVPTLSEIEARHIARVIEALRSSRYRGWFTLENDTRLDSPEDRPLGRISRSVEFLLPLLS